MREFIIALFIILLGGSASGQQRYVFYLHGMIVEQQGAKAVSPDFGPYQYDEILEAFRKEHFTVISEVRAKNTDTHAYAEKVGRQIDSLIKTGVKPGNITVVGASKGSMIAMYTSTLVQNKDVNFVIMAGCFSGILSSNIDVRLCGNILSIYEKSDDLGHSCTELKNRSPFAVPHYKEIQINTGLKHGFLYKPLPEWVSPAIKWAGGNYQ